MAHGDTVVNSNGIELCCIASQLFYFAFHELSRFMQMGMSGHKLGKRVGDSDNGLSQLFAFHSGGHPQSPGSGHPPTFGAECTTQLILHNYLFYQ